jgi:hypothetical protein
LAWRIETPGTFVDSGGRAVEDHGMGTETGGLSNISLEISSQRRKGEVRGKKWEASASYSCYVKSGSG